MARFNFHLAGSPLALCVEADTNSLEELGEQLGRHRFITGRLHREGDQEVEPPTSVLVPLHRIVLVAQDAECGGNAWADRSAGDDN